VSCDRLSPPFLWYGALQSSYGYPFRFPRQELPRAALMFSSASPKAPFSSHAEGSIVPVRSTPFCQIAFFYTSLGFSVDFVQRPSVVATAVRNSFFIVAVLSIAVAPLTFLFVARIERTAMRNFLYGGLYLRPLILSLKCFFRLDSY